MKKKSVLIIAAAVLLLAISLTVFSSRNHTIATAQAAATKPAPSEPLIAGPGRVEPVSEDIADWFGAQRKAALGAGGRRRPHPQGAGSGGAGE